MSVKSEPRSGLTEQPRPPSLRYGAPFLINDGRDVGFAESGLQAWESSIEMRPEGAIDWNG